MQDTVVFTFGRMNPPTIGHQKLLRTVVETAGKYKADHIVYLSQTHKLPDDPLPWDYKRRITEALFRGVRISEDAAIRTPFQALEHLGTQYRNVIMVCGEDRVEVFKGQMSKYITEWGIDYFDVVSSGKRDPDGSKIESASASRARQLVIENNEDGFNDLLPDINSDLKKQIYDRLRNEICVRADRKT